jgi:hypothetical protein
MHRCKGVIPTLFSGQIPCKSGSPQGVSGATHPAGVPMKKLASLGGMAGRDCPFASDASAASETA